jgi:hypothetical protein
MIDRNAIVDEVRQARQARIDAEAASGEVEELIRLVQQFVPGRQRVVFSIEGGEPELHG